AAEVDIEGYRDFRFHNQRDNSVTIGLELKSCQCASILIWVGPGQCKGLDPEELRKRAADSAPTWTPLEQGGEGVNIPPDGVGLLRLKWKTPKQDDARLGVGFWVDEAGDRQYQGIEVPVNFVEAVVLRAEDQLRKADVDIGQLRTGEERTARFVCYSTTREPFRLTPTSSSHNPADAPRQETAATQGQHPGFACSAAEPLSEAERKMLSEKLSRTVRAAYRVSVTVREREGETRLDIGPFHHKLAWSTDVAPGHQVSGHVSGIVQGEVGLADAQEKSLVDLGTISASEPKPVDFTLQSDDPQLQLTLDEGRTLDFLKVEVLDGSSGTITNNRKSWRVRVAYRPDSGFQGKFPNRDRAGYDSAVLCSVVFRITRAAQAADAATQPARRLLVPVRGSIVAGVPGRTN